MTSSGALSPAKWDGTTTASVSTSGSVRTWTIKNDKMAAGNRTITVTPYNGTLAGAAKSFKVTVNKPGTTPPKPAAPTISSVGASPTSGTTATGFTYTVKTSTNVTKLVFKYNGNSKAYTVTSSGALSPAKWDG
ncbi:MAG: hypothetical protein FWG47_03510, partial [Propionibacteriaceae bacterium]|nr:hypothetical protein [Propionibacteriaceae bacterium]